MKVCHFVGTNLAGHYFVNVAESFSHHGVEVVFASLLKEEKPEWLEKHPEIKFYNLGATSKANFPAAIFKLARILRREKIDVLQTHSYEGALIGILAGRLARVPLIIMTRHHTNEVHLIGKFYHTALDRWMAKSADRIVGVSEATKIFLVDEDFIDAKKIEVIYLGFDFSKLNASEEGRRRVREEFGFADKFIIGCIARFTKGKGHEYLLEAMQTIVKEAPDARLFLLGGGDTKRIQELIVQNGLEDYVIIGGFRRDVSDCISAMDIVVHPTQVEAFSQAIIEVLSIGKPLIATNIAGAPEVITDGENGLLIPAENAPAIVESVLRLYRDARLRERLAVAAPASVRDNFTVERMTTKQVQCYAEWLGESPS